MRRIRSQAVRRDGAILLGVVACLLVSTVLIGLAVQSALRSRREARLARQLAQTEWLCEGGLIRALTALRKSEDYTGESWRPELTVEPFVDAVVEIKVERIEGKKPVVNVVARLDSTTDIDGPMQRSRTVTASE